MLLAIGIMNNGSMTQNVKAAPKNKLNFPGVAGYKIGKVEAAIANRKKTMVVTVNSRNVCIVIRPRA